MRKGKLVILGIILCAIGVFLLNFYDTKTSKNKDNAAKISEPWELNKMIRFDGDNLTLLGEVISENKYDTSKNTRAEDDFSIKEGADYYFLAVSQDRPIIVKASNDDARRLMKAYENGVKNNKNDLLQITGRAIKLEEFVKKAALEELEFMPYIKVNESSDEFKYAISQSDLDAKGIEGALFYGGIGTLIVGLFSLLKGLYQLIFKRNNV